MDDISSAYTEVTGAEPDAQPFAYPNDDTHPLSSYSQRGATVSQPQTSGTSLEVERRMLALADVEGQQINQLRDIRLNRFKMNQENRVMADSASAIELLGNSDPMSADFAQVGQSIQEQFPKAFNDPAFLQAYNHSNATYMQEVKSKDAEKLADDRAKRSELVADARDKRHFELSAKANQDSEDRRAAQADKDTLQAKGYGADLDAELGALPLDASPQEASHAISKVRNKAASDEMLAKVAKAGGKIERYVDKTTGLVKPEEARNFIANEAAKDGSRESVSAAKEILRLNAQYAADGDTLKSAELAPYLDGAVKTIGEAARGHKEADASAATASVLGLTTQQVELSKSNNAVEIQNGFARLTSAAAAHPGFNSTRVGDEAPEETASRVAKERQAIALWPTGVPISINGRSLTWDSTKRDAFLSKTAPAAQSAPAAPAAPAAPTSKSASDLRSLFLKEATEGLLIKGKRNESADAAPTPMQARIANLNALFLKEQTAGLMTPSRRAEFVTGMRSILTQPGA